MKNDSSPVSVTIDTDLAGKLVAISKILDKSPDELVSCLLRKPIDNAMSELTCRAHEVLHINGGVRTHSNSTATQSPVPLPRDKATPHQLRSESSGKAWLGHTARRISWQQSSYLTRLDHEAKIAVDTDTVLIALITYGVDPLGLSQEHVTRCVKFLAGENPQNINFLASDQLFFDDLTLAYKQTHADAGRAPRCLPSLLKAFGFKQTGLRRNMHGKTASRSYGGEEWRFDAPNPDFCRVSGVASSDINSWLERPLGTNKLSSVNHLPQ